MREIKEELKNKIDELEFVRNRVRSLYCNFIEACDLLNFIETNKVVDLLFFNKNDNRKIRSNNRLSAPLREVVKPLIKIELDRIEKRIAGILNNISIVPDSSMVPERSGTIER